MAETGKKDFYSGLRWINVSPEEAKAHPMGRPGLLLNLIGAFFVIVGVVKAGVILWEGGSVVLAIVLAIWPLLAGIGLLIAAPYAVYLAGIAAALTLYTLLRNLGAESSVFYLIEMLAMTGILFHLIDGDRPNLVYRHRYRNYSGETPEDKTFR